jgi:hypothetical protein
MNNYIEIIENIEKRKKEKEEYQCSLPLLPITINTNEPFNPTLGVMWRYFGRRKEEIIREVAYLKSEQDNFTQSPISYWLSAEQDVRKYYESKYQ